MLLKLAESTLDAGFLFLHSALKIVMGLDQKVVLLGQLFQLFVQEVDLLITLVDSSIKLFEVLLKISL